MFILFVESQAKSKIFYQQILGKETVLDVPGMTEFPLGVDSSLGLMPASGIVNILDNQIPSPILAKGIPKSELYLFVSDLDKSIEVAISNGGKLISPSSSRPWGDEVGYVQDLDGHLIAFARPEIM